MSSVNEASFFMEGFARILSPMGVIHPFRSDKGFIEGYVTTIRGIITPLTESSFYSAKTAEDEAYLRELIQCHFKTALEEDPITVDMEFGLLYWAGCIHALIEISELLKVKMRSQPSER